MEITVKKIFDWIRKGIVFVLVVSLLFCAGFFVYTKYFVRPTYRAQVKFYATIDISEGESVSSQSVNLAQYYSELAPQYKEFLTNVPEFYEMVAKRLQEDGDTSMNPKAIASCISFSDVIEDTSTFYAIIESSDPATTYNIASAVAQVAPERIESFENVGVLEVLSHPSMPTSPSGPNVLKNTIVGFLFGVLLASSLVVLKEITDNRIKNADEITEFFGLPVFGVVPDFNSSEKKGGRSA